jgi:hypothetical protein
MFLRLQRVWESPENADDVSRYRGGCFSTASPLRAAAAFNFELVVGFLLAKGTLVDSILSPHFLGTPLLRVLRHGNTVISP